MNLGHQRDIDRQMERMIYRREMQLQTADEQCVDTTEAATDRLIGETTWLQTEQRATVLYRLHRDYFLALDLEVWMG